MTMAMFGERMQELRLEIKQRQQKAVDALRALHGYQLKVAAPATVMSTSLPRYSACSISTCSVLMSHGKMYLHAIKASVQ